jgi:hydrogenase expression/formation protein HypC
MCLAIPGQVLEIIPDERHPFFAEGRVSFGGVLKKVCLGCAGDAKVGDYVIVHAGFAISIVDEIEARRVWDYLREMDELRELETGGTDEIPR